MYHRFTYQYLHYYPWRSSSIHSINRLSSFDGIHAKASEIISQLELFKSTKLFRERANQSSVLERKSNVNLFHLKKVSLDNSVDRVLSMEQDVRNTLDLIDIAKQENDHSLVEDIRVSLDQYEEDLEGIRLDIVFSSEDDNLPCFVQILAGTGGLDSFDWSKMMFNMYSLWSKSKSLALSVLDESLDEDNKGIRNITFKLSGHNAYGYMKAEAGVHRLVRISPFDPQKKRHTSFAQVLVYPDKFTSQQSSSSSSPSKVEIKPTDLRIETKRASGPGGQHVNKTDSAVRITHIPTGIVVSCQKERSQHQNRDTAMTMLQSRLWQYNKEQTSELRESLTIGGGDNSWGSQIRSVTLHPYTLVKDHRCGWETSNVSMYLSGNRLLEDCMIAVSMHKQMVDT